MVQSSNKGYRLIDEGTSKIFVHRDVIVNESDFQYYRSKVDVTDGATTNGHEEVVIPKEDEEPVELEQPQPEEEMGQEDQHRYPRRQRTAPIKYRIDEYVDTAFLDRGQMEEPQTIEEALKSKEWKEAADSEYQSLMENETWVLIMLPSGQSQMDFKTKHTSDGKVERYKA